MIRGVHIASSELIINKDAQGSKSKLPLIKDGETITARVVRLLSSNRAQLIISGKKIIAETSLPLKPGEEIHLKAAESGRLQVLKLMPSGDKPLQTLLSLLSSLSKEPFSGLAKLVDSLIQKSELIQKNEIDPPTTSTKATATKATASKSAASKSAASKSAATKAPATQIATIEAKLASIRDLLLSISLKSNLPDFDFLPRLLNNSGLLLEKNLATLVQQVLSGLEDPPSPKHESRIILKSENLINLKPEDQNSLKAERQTLVKFEEQILSKPESNTLLKSESSAGLKTENVNGLKVEKQLFFKPENIVTMRMVQEDLKAVALKISGQLKKDQPDSAGTLKEFAENMEKVQLLNRHTSETGRYVVPFPIFDGLGFRFGQLLFDRGDPSRDQAGKGKQLFKVSVFLDMTSLGALRADFAFLNKEISGSICVGDDETRDYIVSRLPDLKARLNLQGFTFIQIACRVAPKKELEQASLFDGMLGGLKDGILNVVI